MNDKPSEPKKQPKSPTPSKEPKLKAPPLPQPIPPSKIIEKAAPKIETRNKS